MAIARQEFAFLKTALPFWDKLTEKQKLALENSTAARRYPAGSTLHSGANDCVGLFVIKSGQVRAYIVSDSGKEITLFRLFDRDICIFSASCMMKNIRFDIFIEAVQDSQTLLIPTSVYNDLNQSSLAVSDYTNQLLSSRFSDVMWLMEQILFMRFDKRLAMFLLEQSAISGNSTVFMTHEEIAGNMGTAREVVTRMLKYFQTENIVKISRGKILITDPKKLAELAK